jgi:hypothetical protein
MKAVLRLQSVWRVSGADFLLGSLFACTNSHAHMNPTPIVCMAQHARMNPTPIVCMAQHPLYARMNSSANQGYTSRCLTLLLTDPGSALVATVHCARGLTDCQVRCVVVVVMEMVLGSEGSCSEW